MKDTSSQERQWADHLRDEARALQHQQAAAGDTHSPTERVHPYTEQDLADHLRRAVQAERVRCAGIARAWAEPGRLASRFPGLDKEQLRLLLSVAAAIAQDFSTGDDPS